VRVQDLEPETFEPPEERVVDDGGDVDDRRAQRVDENTRGEPSGAGSGFESPNLPRGVKEVRIELALRRCARLFLGEKRPDPRRRLRARLFAGGRPRGSEGASEDGGEDRDPCRQAGPRRPVGNRHGVRTLMEDAAEVETTRDPPKRAAHSK
jgi:hypothetical protein